jgi:hypothetical protein
LKVKLDKIIKRQKVAEMTRRLDRLGHAGAKFKSGPKGKIHAAKRKADLKKVFLDIKQKRQKTKIASDVKKVVWDMNPKVTPKPKPGIQKSKGLPKGLTKANGIWVYIPPHSIATSKSLSPFNPTKVNPKPKSSKTKSRSKPKKKSKCKPNLGSKKLNTRDKVKFERLKLEKMIHLVKTHEKKLLRYTADEHNLTRKTITKN